MNQIKLVIVDDITSKDVIHLTDVNVSGSMTNERVHKQFQGRLLIDTTQEYSVNAEVRQSRKGSLYVYTPTVDITMSGLDSINLAGSVEYLPAKSVNGDLTLTGITAQPVKGRCEYI